MSFADTGPGINSQQTRKSSSVQRTLKAVRASVWPLSTRSYRRMSKVWRVANRQGYQLRPAACGRLEQAAGGLPGLTVGKKPRWPLPGRCAWVIFSSATTSARSANSSTLPAPRWPQSRNRQRWKAAKRKIDSCPVHVIVTDIKMPAVVASNAAARAPVSPDSAGHSDDGGRRLRGRRASVKAGGATDYIRKIRPGGTTSNWPSPAPSPGFRSAARTSPSAATRPRALARQHRRRQSAIETLKQTIRTVATTSSTILVYGESGTAKSL